ncbi:MAG: ATP-binding response regulator [Candidatus Rifleibacteriota bacterium]
MNSTDNGNLLNKILIIEDEPDISDYLYDTLAMSGYEVRQAYDGIEGLEKITEDKPNLVLLDIMMPRLNGLEVCRKIRANAESRATKVIFITAKGSLEEKLEGFQAGANDFIVKPFSSSELLARIESHLRIDMLTRDLEISERRYRQLIEHSPDAIMLFSPDEKLLFVNRRFESILPGKVSNVQIGQSLESLKSSSMLFVEIATLLEKVKTTGLIVTRTFSFSTHKGHNIILEIRGIPSESPSSKGSLFQVVIRDVTEKHNMEKVISRAEKINSLGILTAGIAHEINNPLAGISNAIHILKKDSIDKNKKDELLELILNNINRISRIIDDLRVFSRQERYEQGSSFAIVPVIDETLKLLRYQRDNEQVELNFETNNLNPKIEGSKNQFQQLILNLLLNSSQAISGSGSIKVELSEVETPKSSLAIKISDTGCGIPEDQIEQIFDPFFTTKRDWHGTGLGLAVSYRIVQLLKGSISVSSQVNKGTTFKIVFPIKDSK